MCLSVGMYMHGCACMRVCWHVKANSDLAQYPVLRTVKSTLHITAALYFPDRLVPQTPFRRLWEASRHMLQLMREGCLYTYLLY